MEGIERAITCGVLAGKLRHAAIGRDTETAVALRRAADRYSRGVGSALAEVLPRRAEGVRHPPGRTRTGLELGSFRRSVDGEL